MAVRKIRIWPDPALTEVAKPVEQFDDSLRELVDDMFETMYQANGVGLAATQIAEPRRVLVIDLSPSTAPAEETGTAEELARWGFTGPTAFINPEIVESEGHIIWEEGCLSVPGITDKVKRKERVKVRARDVHGEPFEVDAKGLFAVALQHEGDHLNGRTFVEYLSKLKRDVIRRKMMRLKDETDNDGVAAAAAI